VGICPPSLAAAGGPVFVEYQNITQLVMGTSVVTVATINGGETGLQLMMIVCNFENLPNGYDLRVKPAADVGALFRGAKSSAPNRPLQAGQTEFWEFGLRPREDYEIQAGAELADSIAMTISVSQVFNSGAPEVCPP